MQRLAMLGIFVFVGLLSACHNPFYPQTNSYEQGLMAANNVDEDGAEMNAPESNGPMPRQHFSRGEQVGDEVPFDSGRNQASASNATTQDLPL